MNKNSFFHYFSLFCCIALVAVCFIPWTHYNSINETFTGFHVKRFVTGNYYGRSGMIISFFAAIIFLLTLINRIFAKRVNIFICALLLAYTVRTYIIFTSALFEGEVTKYAGIYLINILAALLLVCAAFPKLSDKKNVKADSSSDI